MLVNMDCLTFLRNTDDWWQCLFADPPDNIGLKYDGFQDKYDDYAGFLEEFVKLAVRRARIVWISFNPRWTLEMASAVSKWKGRFEFKPCVQTFTFGQHNKHDLGNNHRLLWRLKHPDAPLYPDQIRVPSWRQLNGDKRANPDGRVPGDVFDFPRVTGNSKQRRVWHPTQLHEGLVDRCILLSTREGDRVLDPFGGTGTTLRVAKRLNRPCDLVELSPFYFEKLLEEHGNPETAELSGRSA